jgi:vitamin B12 transporter
MSIYNSASRLALVLSLSFVALPSIAADSSATLEEVIVTATREPVDAGTLGASFSVVDRARLEARQNPVLSDILRDLPGLSISPTGPVGAQTQVRIRGAEGNHTLVLIDGIEATDPVGNFELDFADVLTTGIERVELIRGPQSALYGSEAIGGVINILTREPVEGLDIEAMGEGGSFGTMRFGSTVSGGTQKLGATASVGYFDTKGISASPVGTEKDGYENLTFSGKIVARPFDGLTLGLTARRVAAETEFDEMDFVTSEVVDADLLRKYDAFYGRAYGTLVLFDEAWTQNAAVELTDTDTDNFIEGAFDNSFEGERFKATYQSTVALAGTALTGAVEYEELTFKAINVDPSDPSNQRKRDDQTSLVGEWRGDLDETLFLTLGVRHDFNSMFADETTWRAAVAYWLTSGTQIHGSYGTGVSDPTFFDRFGFFPDQFQGNPDLTPEKARGWDIGVRQDFLDDRLVVDITWFSSNLRDEIISVFDFNTFLTSVDNQVGKSKRNGLELTARYRLDQSLFLDFAYTWLDADDPDGIREVRRARHQASASGTVRFLDGRGEATLAVNYNGKQDDLDFATFPASRVSLGAYTLVTLSASWQLMDGLELFGRVENLLDETYQSVLGFNTPGIGAYAGLRVRF